MLHRLSFPRPKEFYEQFKNNPKAARRAAFQVGQKMGQVLKQRYSIQGESLEAVAEILNAAMRILQIESTAKAEGGNVVLRASGFCPIISASVAFNIPWTWLDINLAWPWLEGIASNIRLDIKLTIQAARNRGDSACLHLFEIK